MTHAEDSIPMIKNRIVVFNRLTDSELADCSMFEELLENHYHKFVYFYEIISESDIIENIETISCKSANRHVLDIDITLEDTLEDFEEIFYEWANKCHLSDRFNCDIFSNNHCYCVSIADI